MIDATLRSYKAQAAYENRNSSRDINDIKAPKVCGLRLMRNEYEYDLAHQNGRMLVGKKYFWPWFIRLGWIIWREKIDFDQIIINAKSKQSQRHVPHGHAVDFKPRREFTL